MQQGNCHWYQRLHCRDSSGSHNIDIYRLNNLLRTSTQHVNILQFQIVNNHIEPINSAFQWLNENKLYIWARNSQRNAREACPRADISNESILRNQLVYHCTVQHMAITHFSDLTGTQ